MGLPEALCWRFSCVANLKALRPDAIALYTKRRRGAATPAVTLCQAIGDAAVTVKWPSRSYFSKPSAFIAACTAGRAATRSR